MIIKSIDDYTKEDLIDILNETVDAVVLVDSNLNKYRSIVRKGVFTELLKETGIYENLIQKRMSMTPTDMPPVTVLLRSWQQY